MRFQETHRNLQQKYIALDTRRFKAEQERDAAIQRAERAEAASREPSGKWRTGARISLNVYRDDKPMFQCHTPEDASMIVRILNERDVFKQDRDAQYIRNGALGLLEAERDAAIQRAERAEIAYQQSRKVNENLTLRNGELRGVVRGLVEALTILSEVFEVGYANAMKASEAQAAVSFNGMAGMVNKALASARAILAGEKEPVDYCAHLRKMLEALPVERVEWLADTLNLSTLYASPGSLTDTFLRAYAQAAREARESIKP